MSNGNGTYRIMSAISDYRCMLTVYQASTAEGAKCIQHYYGYMQNDQWELEKVNFGNGGSYRQINSIEPNCFGYAMFLSNATGPSFYAWDLSHQTEAFSGKFQSAISNYAVSCRRIDSHTAAITSNEYRVAVRAPNGHQYGGYLYYYHVIYQLSDGTWAGKNHEDNSKHFGWGNPSVSPEMWDGVNYYPESCGTIYFAVRRW